MKTTEQREARQDKMRLRQEALQRLNLKTADLYTVEEVAALLLVSRSTAWRMLKNEPGVNQLLTPGSRRPLVRIHREVIERILRRTANIQPIR